MLRLPDNQKHHVIVGRNGTGKTRAAMFHFSKRNYNSMPWVVFDFKRDELIGALLETNKASEISVTDKPPRKPGIYIVRPHPFEQDEAATMLTRIWENERTGVYIDEGYMIKSPSANAALELLLTQGRSKRTPLIVLSQRPVWVNRFILSEATFYQVFDLNDDRDKKTLQMFMPNDAAEGLPPFHSWYYDVGKNQLDIMGPVPDDETIINGFQVTPKKKSWFKV